MKKLKIILGLLLLYGAGREYVHASRQVFSFTDPGILLGVLFLLLLCAWLLGSGISTEKLPLKSWRFLKYFGLTFPIFALFTLVSIATFKFDPEIVKVNGIDVDIAEFMNGTKRIVPDENQRREYCICVVTKLTVDKDLAKKHTSEFESGKFLNVIKAAQTGPDANKYNVQECLGSVSELEWTPEFEKGVRISLMKQLTDLQIASTNNVDEYCECLVGEYKKVPIKELTSRDFSLSVKGMQMDSICDLNSKLKEAQ